MVLFILIGLLVTGILLIALPPIWLVGTIETILVHFGIASLVSGVLGLTVERYTRSIFAKDLAKDVFEATIGHLLPEEFQEEMRSIYGQDAICEEHVQLVRIERFGEERVRVICEMDRHIRNIAGKDINMDIGLDIDEWLDSSPSEIMEFGYQVEGEESVNLPASQLFLRHKQLGGPTLSIQQKGLVKVPRNKKITTWAKYAEIKPTNSEHLSHFAYATKNPRVRVQSDDSIAAVVIFPRETGANTVQYPKGAYRYIGLVTTAQEIRVRWWGKADFDKWLAEQPPK